jgi:dTDP-4-amino-4,6-dideoxygalactose transaminase
MVLTDRDDVAEAVRLRRTHGLRADRAVCAGRCSRLDELQAAVLERALGRLDAHNRRRRALAERYLHALSPTAAEMQHEDDLHRSAWHLFPVAVERRDAFRHELARRGVETRVHYPFAIHQHPALRDVVRAGGSLACSERLARSVVSLPLYPELTDDEAQRIVATAVDILGGSEWAHAD